MSTLAPKMPQMPGSNCYLEPAVRKKFRRKLLRWYFANHRDLPWRTTSDPYRIWISEIMLQQTRVAAVLDHYAAFLRRFPSVAALAGARESDVLAAWSGLGYYRRARALHRAAKLVVSKHAGMLPQTSAALLELPGIGRYTANAIASIAYGEPAPVVDGNVERVLTRFIRRKLRQPDLWTLAGELLDRTRPGDFNQALMEFGAILCTPQGPNCGKCPLRDLCASRGQVESSAPRPSLNTVEVDYTLAARRDKIYLVQRGPNESLMAGMWELPQNGTSGKILARLTHSITNRRYAVNVRDLNGPLRGGRWFATSQVHRVALTGLTRKILRKCVTGAFI